MLAVSHHGPLLLPPFPHSAMDESGTINPAALNAHCKRRRQHPSFHREAPANVHPITSERMLTHRRHV